jgi:UDP-N-acetylmuramyl pentapeptide phosphotransferase/UDP-N-acetylglucosamine-1-phosphate transferase
VRLHQEAWSVSEQRQRPRDEVPRGGATRRQAAADEPVRGGRAARPHAFAALGLLVVGLGLVVMAISATDHVWAARQDDCDPSRGMTPLPHWVVPLSWAAVILPVLAAALAVAASGRTGVTRGALARRTVVILVGVAAAVSLLAGAVGLALGVAAVWLLTLAWFARRPAAAAPAPSRVAAALVSALVIASVLSAGLGLVNLRDVQEAVPTRPLVCEG